MLSKGVINYAVQFPGENIVSDLLPPAEGATGSYSAPIYVLIVIRPTVNFTFNKMCSFLIAHLVTFSPGANLPNWEQILDGVPREMMTITGYQYDLSGKLLPVPRQFYKDRYVPPRPFLIEDQHGKLLCTLQFLPWQDGGVLLLKGNTLPLEGLLIFLGKDVLKRARIIKRADIQISYVLPIVQEDFLKMLKRVQSQSNLVVKIDPSKFVVQKMTDEGASSPFIARLFMGIMRLRDVVFPNNASRLLFDKSYEPLMGSLFSTRSASQKIIELITAHFDKLSSGEVGQLCGSSIHIDRPIDKELRKEVETFLNSAVRVLKQGMQEITKTLGYDLGFLFKKQSSFENGLDKLRENDPYLAAYLKEARDWSGKLVKIRNAIEHEGWILPKIRYTELSGLIQADEPEILGQRVSHFVKFSMDRLTCFVEEVVTHCLKARLPIEFSVTEIPLYKRKSEMPERFQVTLANGGMHIWKIAYHQGSFEET